MLVFIEEVSINGGVSCLGIIHELTHPVFLFGLCRVPIEGFLIQFKTLAELLQGQHLVKFIAFVSLNAYPYLIIGLLCKYRC